jgi:putative FmdB family regulatory protein
MPLYEYQCDACGRRFEAIRKFSDPDLAACTLCGQGPVRRLLSSPAIQFKGTGWYITDYAQKGKSSTDGKPDGGAGDSKPAAPSAGDAPAKTDGPASPAKAAKTES